MIKQKKYKIQTFNSPSLSQIAVPLKKGDDLDFVKAMHTILVMSANGVGLAANQIGVLKRAIVIRPSVHHKFTQRMLNPEIVNTDGPMIRDIEGCLSYPGYDVEVSRASGIEISYYDIDWEPQQYWVHGYEARIIQHEIDHLNGICKVGEEWRRIIQEGT